MQTVGFGIDGHPLRRLHFSDQVHQFMVLIDHCPNNAQLRRKQKTIEQTLDAPSNCGFPFSHNMNLASAFAVSAAQQGPKPAIFWGDSEVAYQRLLGQAHGISWTLRDSCSLIPGQRVGIWLRNCPEFACALFGIWIAEGVVVPINNFLKPAEVSFILSDAEIDVLLSEAALSEAFPQLQAARPRLRIVPIEQVGQSAALATGSPQDPPLKERDLAVIIYTSGTTGRPKGAMLTHGNLLHNVESCRQVLQAVSYDRFVVVLPMFHSFMLTVGILLPLLVGGTVVLVKGVQSPRSILQEVLAREATILPAIPQFFRALANAQLPAQLSLRLCISGAAPLPREVLKEFNARMPMPLLEGYGLSEASPVVSINPIAGPWKAGSIGLPIPDVEMSIQDENGVHAAAGVVGEICVRGGNVMAGYWRQPEETAKTLRNGWLLTGDIGYHDSDGYYFITDRKKDMLLVNGLNVYPREIEEVLYEFPGVKEVAVIGVPDVRKGEQPLAFVTATDGAVLDSEALLQFAKERLADYKLPRRVLFLPALPRNATGKILKTELRQMAGNGDKT
jgi:long-chain acyl-CoA synthetase